MKINPMAIFNDFNRFTLWNCRQTFQSSNSTKGIFFVLKLLDSTLIAIVVVVWEEEAHKASLIFYGFKTHSLEIHHYIVNHTKFDCFLCVFKLISSSRWWWDCLVLNFIFFCFDWTSSNHNLISSKVPLCKSEWEGEKG